MAFPSLTPREQAELTVLEFLRRKAHIDAMREAADRARQAQAAQQPRR